MKSPIIQLDAFELVSELIKQKTATGLEASITFFDDVTRLVGPIPNRLVFDVMQRKEPVEEYQLPRNYTGVILRNDTVREGVVAIGKEKMDERREREDVDEQLLGELINALCSDFQVLHNVTLIAHLSGSTIGSGMPNNLYPVTTYSASVVMTEKVGFVIAATDLESLRFDFQMFSPGNLVTIVAALVERAAVTSPAGSQRSLIYTVGLPRKSYIHAAMFGNEQNEWRVANIDPIEDITYSSLEGLGEDGVLFAVNKTDLAASQEIAEGTNPLNLTNGVNSLATLSGVYLLKPDTSSE